SDRIGTVAEELSQLGIAVEARPDGLAIRGGTPRAGLLKSHGDHRVAMAAAVAANACPGPSTVRGWGAPAPSHPTFAEDLEAASPWTGETSPRPSACPRSPPRCRPWPPWPTPGRSWWPSSGNGSRRTAAA